VELHHVDGLGRIQTRAKTFFLGFPAGSPLTATDATVTRVFDGAGPVDVYVLEGRYDTATAANPWCCRAARRSG
jgi:hypothetical protein